MNDKQLKVGAVLSYVYIFINFGITIFFTPILVKYLGSSEYGIYNLAIAFMGYLEILNGGMTSTYIKFASQLHDKEELSKLNGLILKIYLIFGIIASVLGIFATFFVDSFFLELTNIEIKKLKILLYMMIFNVIISSINGLYDSNIVLNEKFIFQKLASILKKILLPIISIPLLICGCNVYLVGLVYVLTNVISLIMNISFCLKKKTIKISFDGKDKKLIKKIIYFYFFVFLTIIVDQINWSVDSFVIGRLRGSFEVSMYSIAHQINSAFLIFSTGISSVFITRIHKINKDDNDSFLKLTQKVGRIQFIILSLIWSGFVLFGKKFIQIWVGNTYSNAYIITLLLITPLVFITIKSILNEVYRAKNKHITRTLIYLGIAIINVFVSYLLCKQYGAIGSATGTTVSLIIGNIIVMNIYDHKVIQINMFKFWKEIIKLFPSVFISFVIGILMLKLIPTDTMLVYFALIIAYSMIYVISLYLIGLNKDEKKIIYDVLKKIKRGLYKNEISN